MTKEGRILPWRRGLKSGRSRFFFGGVSAMVLVARGRQDPASSMHTEDGAEFISGYLVPREVRWGRGFSAPPWATPGPKVERDGGELTGRD